MIRLHAGWLFQLLYPLSHSIQRGYYQVVINHEDNFWRIVAALDHLHQCAHEMVGSTPKRINARRDKWRYKARSIALLHTR